MANNGTLIKLHPPHNTGSANGSGMIIDNLGGAYVFQTPTDNNGVALQENQTVFFDVDSRGKITSVRTTSDDPLGGV